jgi:hypothetical protein
VIEQGPLAAQDEDAERPPMVSAQLERDHDSLSDEPHAPDADGLDASVRAHLEVELESVIGFADYCRFLGGEHVSSVVQELISVAERLYDDTLSSLRGTAHHLP